MFGIVFLAAAVLLAAGIAAMSLGWLFRGRCLRGSCGGPAVRGPDGGKIACAGCPNAGRSAPPEDGARDCAARRRLRTAGRAARG